MADEDHLARLLAGKEIWNGGHQSGESEGASETRSVCFCAAQKLKHDDFARRRTLIGKNPYFVSMRERAMSKGRRSSYVLPDTVEKLRIGRDRAVVVLAGTQPFNNRYNKAAAMPQAIDDLVGDLTRNRQLFRAQPHG